MMPRLTDHNRHSVKPDHDRWYKTYRWQQIRKRQLEAEPLCRMCQVEGRVTIATICDHVEPHRGDAEKFWNGKRQSLCKHHHDSAKQREEKGGKPRQAIGEDGWPL